jgi:Trk-type K+ transport system membrane component
LVAIQSGITLLAWVLWIILDIGQPAIDPGFPGGRRTMDGLFQSTGLRASGFSIILMSSISPALQVAYLVGMYASAYPIIMSLRQTNVYEERSLGQLDTSKDTKTDNRGSEDNSGDSDLVVGCQSLGSTLTIE